MQEEKDYKRSSSLALADALDSAVESKLKVLEGKIQIELEKLAKRIEVLEGRAQVPVQVQIPALIEAKNVVGKVGNRKLYKEIFDFIKQWGSGRKFKLSELTTALENRVEGISKLAATTKKELTRTYLSWLKSAGESKFYRATGFWELGKREELKHFDIVEPRIVLMKNKSFAVYKEVADYILKWGKDRKFTLGELVRELENSVAGWGALRETTLRSYASTHLRYLKDQNQAHNLVGERAWIVAQEPSLISLHEHKAKPIIKPRKKVLGYVRRNPIHQDVLVKIISALKDLQNFSSKDVRAIIDEERSETSDETRRCLTYAYLKYLESNRIAIKTLEGYKIINTELLEKSDKGDKYEMPSLLEDI